MNHYWHFFSKYLQAIGFGAIALHFGYDVIGSWITSLNEWQVSSESVLVAWLIVFLWPFYLFKPIFALLLSYRGFAQPIFQAAIIVNDDMFEQNSSSSRYTDHLKMLTLSLTSAFWIGVIVIIPYVISAMMYFLFLFMGEVISMVAAFVTWFLAIHFSCHFYRENISY